MKEVSEVAIDSGVQSLSPKPAAPIVVADESFLVYGVAFPNVSLSYHQGSWLIGYSPLGSFFQQGHLLLPELSPRQPLSHLETELLRLARLANKNALMLVRVRLQGQRHTVVAGASSVGAAAVAVRKELRRLLEAKLHIAVGADAEFLKRADSPMMAYKSVAQFQGNLRETVIERWLVIQKRRSEWQVRRVIPPERPEEFACDPSGDLPDDFFILLLAGSFLLLLETIVADRVWEFKARPGIVIPARAQYWRNIMLLSVRAMVGDLDAHPIEVLALWADPLICL
ncbi:hypothetical protein MRS44_012405 [Fusarium solani]|uniref:uncharacterized protein n=1 Tax=Fusarium solani TaxID=169388 RepID=UPI0032C3DAFB|nr:hypothetical protein MRS44_012405 [Fusarium solani]